LAINRILASSSEKEAKGHLVTNGLENVGLPAEFENGELERREKVCDAQFGMGRYEQPVPHAVVTVTLHVDSKPQSNVASSQAKRKPWSE